MSKAPTAAGHIRLPTDGQIRGMALEHGRIVLDIRAAMERWELEQAEVLPVALLSALAALLAEAHAADLVALRRQWLIPRRAFLDYLDEEARRQQETRRTGVVAPLGPVRREAHNAA